MKNSEIMFSGLIRRLSRSLIFPLICLVMLAGCTQLTLLPHPTIVPATGLPANGPISPYGWTDENAVMSGICFEAALDTAGQVFVLRDAVSHIRFYELADNSQLCRRPVARYPFDFSGGRALAGLWSYGRGCTARHDVLAVNKDDGARTLTIQLRFVTEGTCNYELLRPFWIGLEDAAGYQIDIQVADTEAAADGVR